MIRPATFVLMFLAALNTLSPIRADEFTIDVQAQAGKGAKSVDAKFPAPDPKASSRAVLMAGVNTSITVKWTARNADKATTVKDALVHFFVVKVEKTGQQEVPKLTKNVVIESALTMDFKANDKTTGELTFTIPNPGSFLLRLEIKATGAKADPFAALDIVVR